MGEIYYLTPHERHTLDELPSDCEISYGDYPPQVPQTPPSYGVNWGLVWALAGTAAFWAIVAACIRWG